MIAVLPYVIHPKTAVLGRAGGGEGGRTKEEGRGKEDEGKEDEERETREREDEKKGGKPHHKVRLPYL